MKKKPGIEEWVDVFRSRTDVEFNNRFRLLALNYNRNKEITYLLKGQDLKGSLNGFLYANDSKYWIDNFLSASDKWILCVNSRFASNKDDNYRFEFFYNILDFLRNG